MAIIPLEPPEIGNYNHKKIFRLPNGDIVVEQSGLQTQYQDGWFNKQSLTVVNAILGGLEGHPLYDYIMQKRVASMSNVNNPYVPIKTYSKPIVTTVTTTAGNTAGYTPDGVIYLKTYGTVIDAHTVIKYNKCDLEPEEDNVPQIQEEPKDTRDRFVPKRMVEID